MKEQMELVAKTFQGLEDVLAEELRQLGAEDVTTGTRMVSFKGDKALMYRANFCCRTALRILKPIHTFTASDADELYRQAKLFDWEQLLSPEKTFAIDETQRMAIEADSTFGEPYATAGMKGLAAARAIGLLTYRGPEGYDLSQRDENDDFSSRRACTYQQYQGEKLCRRYNAYSYYKILNAFDTHDVGYQRGGVAAALQRITAECLVVGISTDIIFTVPEMQALHRMLPRSTYHQIDSPFGHDGFLVEHEQLNRILNPFIHPTHE